VSTYTGASSEKDGSTIDEFVMDVERQRLEAHASAANSTALNAEEQLEAEVAGLLGAAFEVVIRMCRDGRADVAGAWEAAQEGATAVQKWQNSGFEGLKPKMVAKIEIAWGRILEEVSGQVRT
jgi:hypothetical protein